MNSSLCTDQDFGPIVENCRGDFDFTLLFEDTILSLTPSICSLIVATLRCVHLRRKAKIVDGRNFQTYKVTALLLYALIQLALVLLCVTNPLFRNATSVAAAVFATANAIGLCMLSYLEHARSINPSSALLIYLSVTVLFDITRCRTLWLLVPHSPLVRLFTTSVALKLILLILESVEKGSYLPASFAKCRPEELSSILNQAIYFWLNRLMITGSRNVLASAELYELKKSMVSETLGSSFLNRWTRTHKLRKYAALLTLLRTLKMPLLAPVFPRLLLVAMTVCQPLLLKELLNHLSEHSDKTYSNQAKGIVAAYALVFLGTAISSGLYWYKNYQFLSMVRGCLVSIICWKTTRLDILAVEDPKAAVTLMSADVERVMNGLQSLHEIWAYTIQIAIALYLLQRQIGVACVVPVVLCTICGLATAWISRIMNRRQVLWMEALQQRIGLTSALLSSIKQVKMRGFMRTFADVLHERRRRELQAANGWRWSLLFSATFVAFAPEYLGPSLTFAMYLIQARAQGIGFDASRAFTTLSLLTIITEPINGMLQSIPGIVGAIGCLARIQEFLNNPDQKDFRDRTLSTTPRESTDFSAQIQTDIELQTFEQALAGNNLSFEIVSGTFGWGTNKVVLSDIDVKIPARSMTCIIGPIASGKSTLCHTLLGETTAFKGQTKIYGAFGHIAFCSQTPWLTNGSIKHNITLFNSFDEVWYRRVVKACALTADISNMRKRDDTIIGSEGISLSGGQRHKVALARAIYARRPVLILDDIFSGFDPGSADQVFHEVLGRRGLASQLNMTVILATHTIKFLPYADHIIVLGLEPCEGSFAHLRKIPGYVRNLNISDVALEFASKDDSVPVTENSDDKLTEDTTDVVDLARRTGEFATYRYYFGSASLITVAFTIMAMVAMASIRNFSVYWVKLWTDANATERHPDHNRYVGIYALLQILSLAMLQLGAYGVIINMATRTGINLHSCLLNTVAKATLSFFTTTDFGTIANRFSQDIQLIDTQLPLGLVNLLFNMFSAISQSVLIVISAPWIGLAFPVMIVLLYFIQNFYLRTSRQLRLLDLEAKSPLYTNFLESLSGLATIRAFGWQESNIMLNARLLDESQKPVYLLYMVQRWLQFVLDIVVAFVAVIVACLALFMRSNSGSAGVALTQVLLLSLSLKGIILSWTEVETCIGSVSRIKEFEETTQTEAEPHHPTDPGADWPRSGKVEISKATAAYDTVLAVPVLKVLNLDIRSGEKIGICGRSGSGKSSLVLALLHMIETQTGSIKVDGYDLKHMSREVVRKGINVIPQDALFLPLKVHEILDPFHTASAAEMVEALKKVQLWPLFEQFGGLDAEMKKDDMSYGQRQLFSLAGATLRKSKIVILDEATSNVDFETDKLMQRIIREEFEDCTIIAVAHRLETVVDFDRIAVLDHGRLLELDSPSALLARDSKFREMWRIQKSERDTC